jgi:hypothetical protein
MKKMAAAPHELRPAGLALVKAAAGLPQSIVHGLGHGPKCVTSPDIRRSDCKATTSDRSGMHTPRIPQIKKGPLAWLKPLMTLAVVLVSLLHAWEVIEEAFKSTRKTPDR